MEAGAWKIKKSRTFAEALSSSCWCRQKKPRAKAREREQGKADGLKDPAMMEGLIQAITGNNTYAYADSLKKNTSQFRECRIDGSTYIPFNDPATASGYDYAVTNSYNSVLYRMRMFTEDFLNPAKAACFPT